MDSGKPASRRLRDSRVMALTRRGAVTVNGAPKPVTDQRSSDCPDVLEVLSSAPRR